MGKFNDEIPPSYNRHLDPVPPVSPLIKKWMPEASPEEQKAATKRLRMFLLTLRDVHEGLNRRGYPLEQIEEPADDELGGLGDVGTKK